MANAVLCYVDSNGHPAALAAESGMLVNGNYVWDTGSLSWVRMTQPGGGGGGGVVTIADGADVAQGTTTDPDTANTVVGKLKKLVNLVSSTLTVSVSNFPATQPVSGTVAVSNFPATQPVSDGGGSLTVDGTVAVSNFPATQPVSGTVAVSALPNDTYTVAAATFNSSGDNTVYTPAGGNRVRGHYFSLSADGANSADVTVSVKFGGSTYYKVSLKAGSTWARNVGAGRRYADGGVGNPMVVNLSAAQTVHVSYEVSEST